jgi:tRNA-dihydrouridine synthase 3
VTVKIRLGWNKDSLNYLEVARAAVDAGAGAIAVHGRTREARYRHPADWDTVAELAAAVPVPVIGNGDLLFAREIRERMATSGCAAVMVARGALIKPWIFREYERGYEDLSAEDRIAIYRRYVAIGLEHWGEDEYGRRRLREFLRWHVAFWCRYAPQRADGSWPTMQQRESTWVTRSPLEALLARSDDAALDYVTDQLMAGGDFSQPPDPGRLAEDTDAVEAG